MRVMKKIMTGMSVTAFALAIAGGVNAVEADAAGSATFDAVAQTMTAKGTGEVHVSFNAIKVTNKKVDGVAVPTLSLNAGATWDVYDGASAIVDLSNLKTTADQYIAVKDTTTAVPTVYCIPKNADKYTGLYGVNSDSKKGELTFKKGQDPVETLKDGFFQYQTVNANVWTDYAASKFTTAMYEKQSATLYFRQKAVAITLPKTATAYDGFNLYTVSGNFAGTEFKVKIAKEANAPSATVNYDTATFTVKAGQEYRQKAAAAWTAVPTTEKSRTIELTEAELKAAGIFEVRTAATDKKIASKIKVYAFPAAAAPLATEFNVEKNTTGTVAATEGKFDTAGKVNVYYNLSSGGAAQINFLNKTNTAYTVFDASAIDPDINKGASLRILPTAKQIVALPANASKAVVVPATKIKNGTKLYIVRNSDKKAGTFRSLAYNGITVTYPTSTITTAAKGTPYFWSAALPADSAQKDNMVTYYYDKSKANANQINFWNKTDRVVLVYDVDPSLAANADAKPVATLTANAKKAVTVAEAKLPAKTKVYIVAQANAKTGTFASKPLAAITAVTYPAN